MPKKSTQIIAKFDSICPACLKMIYAGERANAWKTGRDSNKWYHPICYRTIKTEVFAERDKNREQVKKILKKVKTTVTEEQVTLF